MRVQAVFTLSLSKGKIPNTFVVELENNACKITEYLQKNALAIKNMYCFLFCT
jgi:hypothetical protein